MLLLITFFDNLEHFPFYDELKPLIDDENLDKNSPNSRVKILNYLLNDKMMYGKLPKSITKKYIEKNGKSITPIDEHIYEANQYLNPANKRLHFTISSEHEKLFNDYMSKYNDEKLDITYSFQKEKTNTLAVTMNNTPF